MYEMSGVVGGNGGYNNFVTGATNTFYGDRYQPSKGGNAAHNHSFSGTNIDLTVQYVDTIIATKN
jgi:hypothetical protein